MVRWLPARTPRGLWKVFGRTDFRASRTSCRPSSRLAAGSQAAGEPPERLVKGRDAFRQEQGERFAEQELFPGAEQAGGPQVAVVDDALGVRQQEAVRGKLDQLLEAVLHLQEFLLGLLQLPH